MIRQFRSEDAPSCSSLIHACLENDPFYPPSLREKIRCAETTQTMIERSRHFYMAVYQSDDLISGLVGLDLNEIRLLFVSPGSRRQGIGRALLEHVKSMVPPVFFSDIFVYSSIHAVGFYQGCGFKEKGYYSFDLGGESLPTVFMTLSTISQVREGLSREQPLP